MIVTFDLFSAMTDSRSGAVAALSVMGHPDAGGVYDEWDRRNKRLQADATCDSSFHELSLRALRETYASRAINSDAVADLELLENSMATWPLWSDTADGVDAVAEVARVGILSNVDDHLCRRTRGSTLVDPQLLLTSQRLGAFKPRPEIYHAAASQAAAVGEHLVHVATSARDVRGATEAGVRVLRLVRPGHVMDPDALAPPHTLWTINQLVPLVRAWVATS